MEDFLIKDKAGVINMHVLDFNEELHNKSLKEEGFEEGQAIGQRKFIGSPNFSGVSQSLVGAVRGGCPF